MQISLKSFDPETAA